MVKCGSLMKSALVAAVLLAVIQFGSADKLAKCCTTVSSTLINEPITGYMVQKPHRPCVPAVIIQTATGVYCVQVNAYWVRAKIIAFEKTKREATTKPVVPSSTVSLLSIITSTASPASPSTSIPAATSFPPTSQTPADASTSASIPAATSFPPISQTPADASTSASILAATSFPPTSQTPADETFAENNSK